MSTITIPSYAVQPEWNYGGFVAYLHIYANETFLPVGSSLVVRGSVRRRQWYRRVECQVIGTELTIGELTLPSTTDGEPNTATYRAVFFDANGEQRDTFLANFQVPDSPSSQTWGDIFTYNNAEPFDPEATYYTALETQQYVAEQLEENLVWGNIGGDIQDQADLIALIDGGGGEAGVGSLFFDATKLQHINHRVFYRTGVQYSHFFWEFWLKPYAGNGAWTGYALSDNQGGNHNLLFGVAADSATMFHLTGNVYGNAGLVSFSSPQSQPFGYWTHVAVGWDGSSLIIWQDGIIVHVQTFTSPYRTNPGGNDPCLFIGGSDHNNYWGNIAAIRGFEGYGRCCYLSDFHPERHFSTLSYASTVTTQPNIPNFLVSYQTNQMEYFDSGKFEYRRHNGVPEAVDSVEASSFQTASVNNYALPTFEAGDIVYGGYVPTAPSTPVGALIFDSFSRANVNYITSNNPSLGQTESGSLGPKTWVARSPSFPLLTGAILNGRGYIYDNQLGSYVDSSTNNHDVRVDRVNNSYTQTGMLVRYLDENNYVFIQGTDTNILVRKRVAGVNTDVNFAVASGWTTLRGSANGTTLNVYIGSSTTTATTLAGTTAVANGAGSTKVGIDRFTANKNVYSWDNFSVFAS